MDGPRAAVPESLLDREGSPWWSLVLEPAAGLYGRVVSARARFWRGRQVRLPVPVASVGNITCGGTGKTPTVEMLVRDLVARGRTPAILSRGYRPVRSRRGGGRVEGEAVNDEYLVLRENLPEIAHYQNKNRVASAREAIAAGADVLVLDDGFQHLRVARDLDLVLIDALRPFDGARLLPAGRLREPLEALERASLLGVTRSELAPARERQEVLDFLRRTAPTVPRVELATEPISWVEGDTDPLAPDALRGADVLAFCGTGNPIAFRRQLETLGLRIRAWVPFRDHCTYRSADARRLSGEARRADVGTLVTTQKDAVKLRDEALRAALSGVRLLYLKIRQTVRAGEDLYQEALGRLLGAG